MLGHGKNARIREATTIMVTERCSSSRRGYRRPRRNSLEHQTQNVLEPLFFHLRAAQVHSETMGEGETVGVVDRTKSDEVNHEMRDIQILPKLIRSDPLGHDRTKPIHERIFSDTVILFGQVPAFFQVLPLE